MNRGSTYTADDDVDEVAASWFLRIQEGFSQSDFKEWRCWLAENEDHAEAFDAVCEFWRDSDQIANLPWPSNSEIAADSYNGVARLKLPASVGRAEQNGLSKTYKWLAMAASIAAVSLIGLIIVQDSNSIVKHYQTATAEHQNIALPDGSSIVLGAASDAAVHYDDNERRIDLLKGEAYFKVAKDKARPFIVSASNRTIRAVGTEFDVNIGVRDIKVSVVEGQVSVEGPVEQLADAVQEDRLRAPLSLRAGEALDYNAIETGGIVYRVDSKLTTAWLDRRLAFNSVSLESVIADVNRYSQTKMFIGDEMVGHMLYTGTILEDDIDNWLQGLEKVFPLRLVSVEGHGILLIHNEI